MTIRTPNLNSYTIYTKSGCSYCDKVKFLLKNEYHEPLIINCDMYLLEDRSGFLSFIKGLAKKEHNTFPIVFKNGVYIGGYEQTKKHQLEYLTKDRGFSIDMNF